MEKRATRRSTSSGSAEMSNNNVSPSVEGGIIREINVNLKANLKESVMIDGLDHDHGTANGKSILGGNGAQALTADEETTLSLLEEDDSAPEAKIAKLDDEGEEVSNQSNQSSDIASEKGPPKRKDKNLHQCPECEKRFIKKGFLTKHIKTHSQPRPFVCDQPDCDKSFASLRGLEKHQKSIHEGEAAVLHLCAFCNRGFITRSEMDTHAEETHLNSFKMYACRYCGKTFTKKFAFKIAVQANQDNSCDPCPYCNKAINPKAYQDN